MTKNLKIVKEVEMGYIPTSSQKDYSWLKFFH